MANTCQLPPRSAWMACIAARAPAMVVMMGTLPRTACARMRPSSVLPPFLVGVLITSCTWPLAIRSSTFGRWPLAILGTTVHATLNCFSVRAVPSEQRTVKPMLARLRATSTACCLSASRTLRNTWPSVGRCTPAAICALANATGRLRSAPITSPVERISGPSTTSTPGNLENGKTLSFTA